MEELEIVDDAGRLGNRDAGLILAQFGQHATEQARDFLGVPRLARLVVLGI